MAMVFKASRTSFNSFHASFIPDLFVLDVHPYSFGKSCLLQTVKKRSRQL